MVFYHLLVDHDLLIAGIGPLTVFSIPPFKEVKEQEKKEKKVIERKTTPKARKKGTAVAPTVDELEEEDEEIPQLVPIERDGEKGRKVTILTFD